MKRDNNRLQGELNPDIENGSSSSEDDEDAELLTEEVEKGFFRVLSGLKKKDAKLYDESVNYYPTEHSLVNTCKKKEGAKEIKKYKEWLKGQANQVEDVGIKSDLDALHDFWANPKINEKDQFLRDYILNKKFLDADKTFDVQKELDKLSEEEKEIEEQVLFEHKFNCRFENPDGECLNKYPDKKGNRPVKKRKSKIDGDIPKRKKMKCETREEDIKNTKEDAKKRNKKLKNKKELQETEIVKEENKALREIGKKKNIIHEIDHQQGRIRKRFEMGKCSDTKSGKKVEFRRRKCRHRALLSKTVKLKGKEKITVLNGN